MPTIEITNLTTDHLSELTDMYQRTRDVRVHTRVQMVLLAAEHHLTATQIAAIVRESDDTVCRWLKRYQAEGIDGLHDHNRRVHQSVGGEDECADVLAAHMNGAASGQSSADLQRRHIAAACFSS